VSNHGIRSGILVVLHHQKTNAMHITLTVQSVLTHAFELLIFAPLPILLLTAPFGYVKEWFVKQNQMRIVKKHYSNLEVVGIEQLKKVFPRKGEQELEDIAFSLNGNKVVESYKI
jgi:hypothetical protein